MKKEIQALREIGHPSLLKILDSDDKDSKWYVSEFHQNGPLAKKLERFKGKAVAVLNQVLPLIEGISHLHQRGIFHRDIKTENIFLNNDHQLVLGDFGIAIDTNDPNRPTETYENKGSRDWMPPWAMGMRVEKVTATFDVFSIGKVIWSMISGQRHLQLWYFNRQEFNLENLFPDNPEMKWVNELLSKCIVENEGDCLQTADDLLSEVKSTLRRIDSKCSILSKSLLRQCNVCGIGTSRF